MNSAGGFITLHRKLLSWEWYKDSNTKDLFIHLLLSANFTDTRFLGKKIKRGQVVTSLSSLAEETGMSVQNVKTALKHLISTNEVTNISTDRYRIITVVKYDEYQSLTMSLTTCQQSPNKVLTKSQQHHNNDNNVNKGTMYIQSPAKAGAGPSFDQFWSAYPKKVAKAAAQKAWTKLSPDDGLVNRIMDSLRKLKGSDEWKRDDGRYIPHASTWLNGRRWEDEVTGGGKTDGPDYTVFFK